ncbi:MAG: methyltransferase [Chloroflexi bacterium]|nr:MAG: methyltransferase [Chloroflexota bacterium]
MLTPRERFSRVMAHQEPDRVPLDLAGTSLTAIDPGVARRLGDLLGFSGDPPGPYQAFDERILQALEIDFRRVGSLIGSGDRPVPGDPDRQIDMWGVERAWTGQYWDIVSAPLKNATIEDLRRYPWPEPERWFSEDQLLAYQAEARRLWEETDYVVVAEHPVYGVFELGCWMCGFDDFLYRTAGDPDFVRSFFDIVLDLQKRFIGPYYQAVGQYIHLTTSGDDFGMQTGLLISPRAFRSLVKPYYAERIAFTRQFTPAYYWHHSCGSVHALIPDLTDCGVDILNPIQPGAFRMEPERLKAEYGNTLCFHGGFDTQNVLPFGSQAEIEAEVARVMDAMKPGGGYIFSAAHNIQDDVPAENVLAMYHAARHIGVYR